MKLFILLAVIGACAAGALPRYHPQQYQQYPQPYHQYQQYPQYRNPYYQRAQAGFEQNAAILRSVNNANENGYQYAYETENGIKAEETGVENNGIQAAGSYSYTGDDGQLYAVRYTADANGFRPEGAHLPTPPPIPEAIARSLELNARDEAAGIYDDGSYNDGKYEPAAYQAFLARNRYNKFYNPAHRYNY